MFLGVILEVAGISTALTDVPWVTSTVAGTWQVLKHYLPNA